MPIAGTWHKAFYTGKIVKTAREEQINMPRHELFQKSGYRWPFIRHFKYTTVMTANIRRWFRYSRRAQELPVSKDNGYS